MSVPSPLNHPWLAPARRCLVGLAAVCWALGVQAAVVQPSVDLLQPGAAVPAAATSALERALTVDTNTSQRNLDLLLDARRAGDAAGPVTMRSGELPAHRRTLPVAEPRVGLVPLGLQGQDSVSAPGAAERREWLGSPTAGRQPGMAADASGGSGAGGGYAAGQSGPAERGEGHVELGELGQVVADAVQFMREHRVWLLGGLCLLALVASLLQAYTRRR